MLDGMDVSAEAAERLIMRARVAAGWIEADALKPDVEEADEDAVDGSGDEIDFDDIDLADLEAEAERLGVDLSELLGEDPGVTEADAGDAPAEDADRDQEDDEKQ
jgi:N utilization substance protein A